MSSCPTNGFRHAAYTPRAYEQGQGQGHAQRERGSRAESPPRSADGVVHTRRCLVQGCVRLLKSWLCWDRVQVCAKGCVPKGVCQRACAKGRVPKDVCQREPYIEP